MKFEAILQQLSFCFRYAFLNKDIALTMAPQSNVANIVVFQLGSSFVETIPNPSIGKFDHYGGISNWGRPWFSTVS